VSSIRVLVVDDYEPFRRFICSTLAKRPELQIVWEAADGLEAVRKSEELQPDLIVLDIGLPTLNGIEAARRIRKLAPDSKLLFLSQESSADVVQEALSLGALGYVVKAHAGNELSAAVGAVLAGQQFISSGLSGHRVMRVSDSQARDDLRASQVLPLVGSRKSEPTRRHSVEFYSDDAAFVAGFARFIKADLEAGNAIIVVATESHQRSIVQTLQEQGVDILAAIRKGRYVCADVADTLSTFMRNHLPDPMLFFKVVGDLIAAPPRAAAGESRVSICGECASLLWAQGKADAAIQVEQLCNQLAKRSEMNILCGFSLSSLYREEDKRTFQEICGE
jgi:DNA-binding NarL/FixJ family response regulator